MTRILLEMANLLLIYLIAFYCVLAFVTLMIRWVNFWVRWSYFVAYQTLFLITLRIFFAVVVARHHTEPLPASSTILYSIVIVYV